MAFAARHESFLPTIKCSTCGVDIPMDALADHLCVADTAADSSTQAYGTGFLSRFATQRAPSPDTIIPQPANKARFNPPPRIDAAAANRTYLDPTPPTPNTHGTAYRDAPQTPNDGIKSPAFSMRSVRQAPPSPPMTMGYDNPFPPWPSSPAVSSASRSKSVRNREPKLPNPPRNPRLDTPPTIDQPLKSPGQNVLKRMNTIARGPFEARSQKTQETSIPAEGMMLGHRRNKTSESAKSFRSRSGSVAIQRPSTSHTNRTQPSIYAQISNSNPYDSSNPFANEPPMPTLPQIDVPSAPKPDQTIQDIDKFLEQLPDEQVSGHPGLMVRSNTYPEDRQPTLPNVSLPELLVRSKSTRSASRNDTRIVDAPPVPRLPGLQTQFPGIGSGHSPTESASSNGSVFSSNSSHSSRSSPPESEAGLWSRRPSDASVKQDPPARPRGRSGTLTAPRLPNIEPPPPMPHSRQRSRTVNTPPPFRKPSRDLETEAKLTSPVDPAIQHSMFETGRRPSELPVARAPLSASPPLKRHATTAARSTCRGCTTPILGKAIKAADGRITGRWHKDCFVCLTCKASFPTGDFYVINDQPYCERHYHSLNGSLCGACDGGIEGQYLETDRGKKYHKLCFTCDACDIPLRDEYYEVSGKQYCERHALAKAQRNADLDPSGRGFRSGYGGGARPEKRSTRLMMI